MSIEIATAVIVVGIASIATSSIGIQAYNQCTSPSLKADHKYNFNWMVLNLILAILATLLGSAMLYFSVSGKQMNILGNNTNKIVNFLLLFAGIASIATSAIGIQAYNKCSSPSLKANHPVNFKWMIATLVLSIVMTLVAGYDAYMLYFRGGKPLIDLV